MIEPTSKILLENTFCDYCKYVSYEYNRENDRCKHPNNSKAFVRHNRLSMPQCSTKNTDGHCPLYVKKWFLFWR